MSTEAIIALFDAIIQLLILVIAAVSLGFNIRNKK